MSSHSKRIKAKHDAADAGTMMPRSRVGRGTRRTRAGAGAMRGRGRRGRSRIERGSGARIFSLIDFFFAYDCDTLAHATHTAQTIHGSWKPRGRVDMSSRHESPHDTHGWGLSVQCAAQARLHRPSCRKSACLASLRPLRSRLRAEFELSRLGIQQIGNSSGARRPSRTPRKSEQQASHTVFLHRWGLACPRSAVSSCCNKSRRPGNHRPYR